MTTNKVAKCLEKIKDCDLNSWGEALWHVALTKDEVLSEKEGRPIYNNKDLITKMVIAIGCSVEFQGNKDFADLIARLLIIINKR